MGNVVMEATQINYRRDEKLKTVDQKLQELSQESAIDTDIAPVFKSNITYHPGDMVYYRNKLYVFTAEHTGAWAAGDVTATDVSTAMNTALAGKADYADIAGAFSAETAYTAGDLVIYNGIIYRCTNDHTGDWDADDFSATTIGAELNALNSNITNLRNDVEGAWESLTLSDVFTAASGIAFDNASAAYRRGNRVRLSIIPTGTIDVSAGGYKLIGTIANAYRPVYAQTSAGFVNKASSGVTLTPVSYTINTSGNVNLIYGVAGSLGNELHSWTDGTAVWLEWSL